MNDPFSTPLHEPSVEPETPARLDHLSLLLVRGADARAFLDSQLTRNVPVADSSGAPTPASMAGYCSPKGRLLASFVIWSEGDAVSLLLSRDIADGIAKRLRMYVLRAKVTIADVTATEAVEGIVEPAVVPPDVAALDPWESVRSDARLWIRFPDAAGRRRYLRIGNVDHAGDDSVAAASEAWRLLDIQSGLPRITSGTQDRFVPQMLNLEALGAVDFKKGCFPGQEVVARSQYLGKLKRRMAIASTDADGTVPAPGTDVWGAGDGEASGLVVNAEPAPDGRTWMLVELPLALFASDRLRVGTSNGPPLAVEPPPYALPDNEVFVRPRL